MNHDAARESLGAYALDACGLAETAAIEGHLQGCADCRGDLAAIQRVSGWLGVSEMATPPTWLRAQIMQEAEKETLIPGERRHGVAERRGRDRGSVAATLQLNRKP